MNDLDKIRTNKLVEELRAHHIELARQNAKLQKREAELEQARAQYSDLFDNAPVGYVIADGLGNILSVNQTLADMLECTKTAIMEGGFSRFLNREEDDFFFLHCGKVIRSGKGVKDEVYFRLANDRRMFLRFESKVLDRSGDDRHKTIRTAISDLTEQKDISGRKEAQRKRQESRNRFALFMDYLPVAVFIKDARSRVLYVNEYVKRNFGEDVVQDTDTCGQLPLVIRKTLLVDDRRALSEGRYDLVERLRDRSGQERTFRTIKFAIPRSEGQSALLGCIAWDISEALAASESLARGKRRYREVFEIAEEGIWLIDAEASTVDVNERMARMLGYKIEEMRGRHLFEFMDEQAREVAQTYLVRCRRGIAEKYDFRFRTKRGDDLWAIVSTAPMYDAQGAYAGAVRMVTDITERKRAEDALRANEEQLRLILSSTGEGIFGLDLKGCCTFANRACIELLGWSAEEDLLGKKIHQFIHHTRQDGTEYPAKECPTYRSFIHGHVTFADDELLWRRDGTAFHAEYQSFPMVRDDMVVGAVVSFADITERKQAEAALKRERDFAQRLIETAPVIVLLLDPEGNIVRFNSFMEKLSGYSLAEVKGRNWFETFLPEGDVQWVKEVFSKAKEGIPTSGNLNAIVTRDGKERLIAWYDTTLHDATGALSALLAIGHDVTDQKAKEAQLLQAQKMEAVGQLTGGIAHDFNNLLTVILGNLNLLAKSLGPPRHADDFELIEDSLSAAQDGAELIQRLLAFSRREPLQRKCLDLATFLDNFHRFLKRMLGADISVELNMDSHHDKLFCDPPQLESALLNLALNARDAMPQGGRLSLRTETKQASDLDPTLKPGTYVEIAVIDTGEGMTPEQLSRAIEPFYTTKRSGQGSGLGLSMVFGFCEQAGGRFRLASQPGAGTKATILLPVTGVGDGEIEQALDPKVRTHTATGTVLVVEDEERVRRLAGRYLRDLGYDVLTAENGEKAIEILATESAIDLVFSDLIMPGKVNGDDLYRWVEAQRPKVKVLLTSGLGSEEIEQIAEEDDSPVPIALPKPYTKEQLAEAIHEVFQF